MPNDTNTFYMVDLDFCRSFLDENQYTSVTVYNPVEKQEVIDDLAAQGWTLYMSREW